MKKIVLVQSAIITGLLGALLIVASNFTGSWPTGIAQASTGVSLSQSARSSGQPHASAVPEVTPTSPAWRDELPPASVKLDPAAPSALPTPAPGETLVYFLPADGTATGTVLNLYNTDAVTHTVIFRGYYYNGVQIYFFSFNLPPYSFQRLVSDDIVASPPTSWATPLPYVISFGDSVYFASLSLLTGVKLDGYTLFNAATGTIDPRADQGAIPLRFSTDPATVFLPGVSR